MTITAKVIADNVNPDGVRITTLQLRYPKFCHNELMTHRVFSRNSSSSRAIPVERLIQDVLDDPVIPSYWGSNRPGMQAGDEISVPIEVMIKQWITNPSSEEGRQEWNDEPLYIYRNFDRETAWLEARDRCIEVARGFAAAGYHKQIVNRLIEPWCHINTVVTSTEWANFFRLRCHKDAQPEMRRLADSIKLALNGSMPERLEWGDWHLPYATDEETNLSEYGQHVVVRTATGTYDHLEQLRRLSVARCARVSYLTHDQKQTTLEEDLKLFERLTSADPKHLSPTEHQAQATPGTFKGRRSRENPSNFHPSWLQYRKMVE